VVLLGDVYSCCMQLEMKGKVLCVMDGGRVARSFQRFDYAALPVNYGYFSVYLMDERKMDYACFVN